MRVTTAFKRLLCLLGAFVVDVSFTGEGVLVTLRLRRRRRVCSSCGQTGRQLEIHDRPVKRWRHLDLGACRCLIECELRLLRCRTCGVRMEPVPWARPGAAHTRDFEDVVAWLAQQTARTPICGVMRVGWDTVGRIVARVVADHLDERRLEGPVCIGVDEISYRLAGECQRNRVGMSESERHAHEESRQDRADRQDRAVRGSRRR